MCGLTTRTLIQGTPPRPVKGRRRRLPTVAFRSFIRHRGAARMRDQVSAAGSLQQLGFCDFSPKRLTVVKCRIKELRVSDNGLKVLLVGPIVGVWWHRPPRRLRAPAPGSKARSRLTRNVQGQESFERSVAQRFYRLRHAAQASRRPPHATAKSSVSSPPIDGLFFSLIRLHISPVGNACQVPSRLLTHCVSNTLDERSRSFSGPKVSGKAATVISPVELRSSAAARPRFRCGKAFHPKAYILLALGPLPKAENNSWRTR